MRRFFTILLGAMALLATALLSAFISMRLAIHGREVRVPDLTHMSLVDAGRAAGDAGLRLRLENKFYSPDTPAGEVLAQYPAAGAVVRREWPVRVTESLGTQQVSIPDLIGQSERSAMLHLRQLRLEPGITGHIPIQGPSGIVVAQSPSAGAVGVDSPRVSILVSDPPDDEDVFIMPSLTGIPLATAGAHAATMGLHVVEETASDAHEEVVSQTPPAGYRVTKDTEVHLTTAQ